MSHCHLANLYQESAFESGIPRKTEASGSKQYRHIANALAGRGNVTVAGSSKWRKIMPGSRPGSRFDPACCAFASSTCRPLLSFSAIRHVRRQFWKPGPKIASRAAGLLAPENCRNGATSTTALPMNRSPTWRRSFCNAVTCRDRPSDPPHASLFDRHRHSVRSALRRRILTSSRRPRPICSSISNSLSLPLRVTR